MKNFLVAIFIIVAASLSYADNNDSLRVADSVKLSKRWPNWPTWYGDTLHIKRSDFHSYDEKSYIIPDGSLILYGNDSVSIAQDKKDVLFYHNKYNWVLPRTSENQKGFEGMPERMQLFLNPGRIEEAAQKEWRIYWFHLWKCGQWQMPYTKA